MTIQQLRDVLKTHWGYDGFLPLQQEAMQCVLEDRDSVVVLPTGGGKSLCFQAPAVVRSGVGLVVSPLISLMKDQVDGLNAAGVPAACLNSSMEPDARRRVFEDLEVGNLKLLYIAPERLVQPGMLDTLAASNVSLVAIDEAHCISQWGHDFRPEYRQLKLLKERLPGIAIHAYTATATTQVREDMIEELELSGPEVLVGSFDRPNLSYKIMLRDGGTDQMATIMDRHRDESGIIYCISRRDVEKTSEQLNQRGYQTRPYHAGMSDEERRDNQDAFIGERVDTIVATVAFGMGIDKSNVRYVIHAAMPKSLEGYQQETGRAGRDGLEAECCLLYTGGDYGRWRAILDGSDSEPTEGAWQSLQAMQDFAGSVVCRHAALVEYFGQSLDSDNCGACDVCLGELDQVEDPLVIGQKILSSVIRQEQRFGADYTVKVLRGSSEQRILDNRHDQLSTYGLLADEDVRAVRAWVEQLVAQGFLAKVGEYNVLVVTESGRQLLTGEVTPRLLKPARAARARKSRAHDDSWEGVDRELFERLRELRRELADEKSVPAYVVFGDASLRDMARQRPGTPAEFLEIHGVGQKKAADYGEVFLAAIGSAD
ncbi:MAG: DNA helicase RecQ [Planctomycetota bacterium]|nr:DNA helicase RecQ [Planctomycetota bacterium]MEC9008303.1 DNA helicase RecQ [Planctomycetota bacterium]MED5401862.1 DNA helicase RecQ [Planctomycetota bacterium]MEE3366030.1 DNA helicase RecQ [Planctomycetota bacterium]